MGTVLGRGVPDLMAPVAEEAPAVVPPDKDEVVIDPDQYESCLLYTSPSPRD